MSLHRAGWVLGWLILAGVGRADWNWRDATTLEIEGRGWTNTASPYDRLPATAQGKVPDSVWGLSRQSAGLAVRFETTAERVAVRWSLTGDGLAMPHMPATGVSGVDLYVHEPTRSHWSFVQNGRPSQREGNVAEFQLGPASEPRTFLLYLPLYNGVSRVEIGTAGTNDLRAPAPRPTASREPVVFYGTSIVQGACASRPGLAHVAILGRALDRPVINLGFSGSGKMEPAVVDLLAELDPAAYVIDCLWNISDQPPEEIARRAEALVRRLRQSRPRTPIVLVGQSEFHVQRHPTPATSAQERVARALFAGGDTTLSWVDGAGLLGGDGEGTVDGVHPNDLGMMRQADALLPAVRRAVRSR